MNSADLVAKLLELDYRIGSPVAYEAAHRIEALEARLAEAMEVMKPFIDYINVVDASAGSSIDYPDERWVVHGNAAGIDFGNIRAARRLVEKED